MPFAVDSLRARALLTLGVVFSFGLFVPALPGEAEGRVSIPPTHPGDVGSVGEEASVNWSPALLRSHPTWLALTQRLRHFHAMGLPQWHLSGYRGRGVKVAILDSGWRGYRQHLTAALPAKVTARSFRKDGNLESKDSQHGILCAEVVHAIAPEAELLL